MLVKQLFSVEDSSSFYSCFSTYQSEVVKHHMCKDLRESIGLGSPPVIFTTNGSESINALIKRKVNHKESDWPHFTDNATTPAPGSHKKSCMVISYFQVAPHLVQSKSNGQYVRDSNCQQWASSQICSHVLATAKCNNELCCFLEWYTMYAESPNISGVKPSYDYDLHNQLLSNESDNSANTVFSQYTATLSFLTSDLSTEQLLVSYAERVIW